MPRGQGFRLVLLSQGRREPLSTDELGLCEFSSSPDFDYGFLAYFRLISRWVFDLSLYQTSI